MTARGGDPGPVRVIDINLDRGSDAADARVPEPCARVFALVRFHGITVGVSRLPASGTHLDADAMAHVVASHADSALQHVLADRMLTHGVPARLDAGQLLETAHPENHGPWPSVTVAVCTRGRPDELEHCLAALVQLDYPAFDLLVIDNAPGDASVQQLIDERYPQARYVREPRPGLDWARNRAVLEATGEIVAFTDDDARADREWLRALVRPMVEEPDVMATAGLVMPLELETAAQQSFEAHGGLGRGFVRRWVRVPQGGKTARAGNPTTYGTGANMAFRRSLFAVIGGFDPALDVGTPSSAGGDTEMFFRVLKAGHTFAYDPAALVRHRHRRDHAAVERQLGSWLLGVHAAFVSLGQRYPEERAALWEFSTRLLMLYYPRRVTAAMFGSALKPGLVLREWVGFIRGRARYGQARRDAARIAAAFAGLPTLAVDGDRSDRRPLSTLRAKRRVQIDVSIPLPERLPGPDDADDVEVAVVQASRAIGSVEVVSGGRPIARRRLADAIVARLGSRLADPRSFRRALHSRVRG